jgi:hypothetical protein
MASRSAQTQRQPVRVRLADGSFFVCPCRSNEFRITGEEAELHLFCRCGQIYVAKDLPPLWEDE